MGNSLSVRSLTPGKIWVQIFHRVAELDLMKSSIITACLAVLLVCSSAVAQETEDDVFPLLKQSSMFMRDGKKAEAQEGFEKCLKYKLSPKHESIVRACLGSLYYDSDRDKAIEYLKKARELDATNYGLLVTLASALGQKREFDAAKECLNTYLKNKPDGESAEDARKLLANIESVQAESGVLTKINAAADLYNAQKYDEALALLEETQKQEHDHKKTEQQLLGLCYSGQGKYKKAVEIFQKSLEADPKQPKVVSALAGAYEGMGDLKNARETLKRYLHMDNKNGEMATMAKDRIPTLKKVMKTAGDAEGPDYFKAVCTKYLARWSMTRMPLRVWVEPGTGIANYSPDFDACVPRALDLWCKASEGKISWTPALDKANCDIEVMYTADPKEVGKSESHSEAGICHTRILGLRGAKIAAVTHATIKMLTNDNAGRAYTMDELSATAAHEVGHALGMKEHSSNPNDTMFFAATKNPRDGLTPRDVATIKAVYNAVVYDDGRIEVAGSEEKKE
jgi:tetratricopeptide (TPR) repeat protein